MMSSAMPLIDVFATLLFNDLSDNLQSLFEDINLIHRESFINFIRSNGEKKVRESSTEEYSEYVANYLFEDVERRCGTPLFNYRVPSTNGEKIMTRVNPRAILRMSELVDMISEFVEFAKSEVFRI
jgi:hypothetical protein